MKSDIQTSINDNANYLSALSLLIVQLQSLFFEDYNKNLNKNSSDSLLEFFTYHTNIIIPSISAEEDGTVLATWKKNDECFVIRFVDEKTIDFAIAYMQEGLLKRDWGRENPYKIFKRHCPGYIFNLF